MHVRARPTALLLIALLAFACGAQDADLEPAGTQDAESEVDGSDPTTLDTDADDTSDSDDTVDDADADDDGQPAPSPDAALLEDPCAEHEGREQDVFIDLVAPVDDQQVHDEIEIVGCANVFEATVLWRLLDGDGDVLEEGFTTAACGTGCVGEFREEVPLPQAQGEPVIHLQVYWESAEDGSERDLVERVVALG